MERQKLIFLGDSITDCDRCFDERPEPLGSGYVRVLKEEYLPDTIRCFNRGHDGYTAGQVKQALERDCLMHDPQGVSLLVGINDVCASFWGSRDSVTVYRTHLKQMVDMIRARTHASYVLILEPFVFSVPQEFEAWKPGLAEFRMAAREAAEETGVDFLPLQQFWEELEGQMSPQLLTLDGIHLTPLGHRYLAQRWYDHASRHGAFQDILKQG